MFNIQTPPLAVFSFFNELNYGFLSPLQLSAQKFWRERFKELEMDTDSLYLALSEKEL